MVQDHFLVQEQFQYTRELEMITFTFEGTSHGEGYSGRICGLPAGFRLDIEQINAQLALRKCGYGRSVRQMLSDEVLMDSECVTEQGEVHFRVLNKSKGQREDITALRSGHADVTGRARYPEWTVREIAERASARSSVCYVVLGAICKQLLASKGIYTYHYTEKIGGIAMRNRYRFGVSEKQEHFALLHCPCRYATARMCEAIDRARAAGNSLGGVTVVGATGVPMGLGDISPYTERLDAVIAANLMGIPSVKGISFGIGGKYADSDGVTVNDRLEVQDGEIVYATNNCGGIAAGISTGADILCRLIVKPVPTVRGVNTIDSRTLQETVQHFERADTCVVPNVGVIAENILAYVIADKMADRAL